ncbi:hypothetical protein BOTNAR_0088g00010 [Botryotinia narcissicola]|uniref:Uncharacterized protein n=1 Tax=Botryotinia narcissicola TaxID=278944 RepID=A0A4Z1IYC8_9HELO|nr:hypothetical protein BOTNAR_0088g00010 [Botryotinia narcissicola]
MAPYTHKRKIRDGISHRNTPTSEAQTSEDRKKSSSHFMHLPVSWRGVFRHFIVIANAYYIHHRSSANTISQIGKISKNIAARSAIAARIRQEYRNQRRLAKPAALNSKDAETDGDVCMKADEEGGDEDPSYNVDKAMDILQDQKEDKEGNEDKRRGVRGAGSTWEIPFR